LPKIVFVRKRLVEVQYLRTTITDKQSAEFGHLVEGVIQRIESAQFLPDSGIRFPQNPCSTCPYLGHRLGKQETANTVWCGGQELTVLIGLTSLVSDNPLLPPKFNHRRATSVLHKIGELLAWERRKETEGIPNSSSSDAI
jgi:hypothetical protein